MSSAKVENKYKKSAAFYDVDGTLITINIVHTFAFYAARQASWTKSLRTTLNTALSGASAQIVTRMDLTGVFLISHTSTYPSIHLPRVGHTEA